MQRIKFFIKNKYIFTSSVFLVYMLFLDDIDVFTIINQNIKLSQLEKAKTEMNDNLSKTKKVLKELKYTSELERFAREKKLFKKDDEDIFVISYE